MDNKGHMIIDQIAASTSNDCYKDGWGWAAELVNQHYLKSPNYYANPNATSQGAAGSYIPTTSVFRCPEGSDLSASAIGLPTSGNYTNGYPTWVGNNGYYVDGAAGTPNFPRADGGPLYAVACWYQLNSRVDDATGLWPGNPNGADGLGATPFVWFQSTFTEGTNNPSGNSLRAVLSDPLEQRTLTMIKRAADTVMVLESTSQNWCYQLEGNAEPSSDGPIVLPRLGARHGQKTASGFQAYTNLAFFDGHVATFPTAQLTTAKTGTSDYLNIAPSSGNTPVFFLNYE
jgi:prepilin-type processing-associated H-X9-DG protein